MWQWDPDDPVEPPGTQNGLVQEMDHVCAPDHQYLVVLGKTVHFGENLVDGVIGRVVFPGPSQRIDFVNEDDRG